MEMSQSTSSTRTSTIREVGLCARLVALVGAAMAIAISAALLATPVLAPIVINPAPH
jgi:hypothetical protein